MLNIDTIWVNLKTHEGETFYTVTGLPFTYVFEEDAIKPYREDKYVGRKLTKQNFVNALSYDDMSSVDFSNHIIGSAYVRALLLDERI